MKRKIIFILFFLILLLLTFFSPTNHFESLVGTSIGLSILIIYNYIPRIRKKLEVYFSPSYILSMEYRIYMLILILFYTIAEYYSFRIFYVLGLFLGGVFLVNFFIDYFKREGANRKLIVFWIVITLLSIFLNVKKLIS